MHKEHYLKVRNELVPVSEHLFRHFVDCCDITVTPNHFQTFFFFIFARSGAQEEASGHFFKVIFSPMFMKDITTL